MPSAVAPVRSICLATITREDIHVGHHASVLAATQTPNGSVIQVLDRTNGPYLDDGRNLICEDYLNLDPLPEWILMYDSDVVATPDQFAALVADIAFPHATPVIGGVYANPDVDGKIRPVVYGWGDKKLPGSDETRESFIQLTKKELRNAPPFTYEGAVIHPDICAVSCIGTGFMAIHHSVLVALMNTYGYPMPFFDEPVLNDIHLGEDMGFCARVRALGYPVLCHRGVRVAHYKKMRLTI